MHCEICEIDLLISFLSEIMCDFSNIEIGQTEANTLTPENPFTKCGQVTPYSVRRS